MTHQPPYSSRQIPHLVALTLWVYQRLLVMHPPAFRRDFGGAILQVFRQTCLDAYQARGSAGVMCSWFPAFGDLVSGAIAEHVALVASQLKGSSPMQMYRRSASIVFCAFVAFVVAGIGFQKMTEYEDFSTLAQHNIVVGITYVLVVIGAVAALAGVLAGGVPIALASLRFAVQQRRWDVLSRFAVPPSTLVVLFGYLKLMAHIDHHPHVHTLLTDATFGTFVALFMLAALTSAASMISAVNRSEVDERLLRWAVVPGALTVLAMGVVAVSMIVWSASLWQSAPDLFFGDNGLLASSTVVNLAIVVAVMVAAAGIAARALLRANHTPSVSTAS